MSKEARSRRAIAGLLEIIALSALAGCPGPLSPDYDVAVTRDVVYGVGNVSDGAEPRVWTQKDLLMDVYAPDGLEVSGKPALLLVHGGSFQEGSKEKEEIVSFANFFAQRGFVAFAMNYRLDGDYPPAPDTWDAASLTAAAHAAMVDVKACIRHIRANATAYGIDPDKIALLGESAGAIAGVVAAITSDDYYETDNDSFPVPPQNSPGVSGRVQAYMHFWGNADIVLLHLDRGDPPIMIVHGTDDDNFFTPFSAAERLHGLLELFNMPHAFYAANGFEHGAWGYRLRGDNLKDLTLDFLAEHLLGLEV
jgi:dienelactone hydrolase